MHEEKPEAVRSGVVALQVLGAASLPRAAVRCGEWLTRVALTMGDLSESSDTWWASVMLSAHSYYKAHLVMTPLERLDHAVLGLESSVRYGRVRARVSTMLLEALPEDLGAELVSRKELHPVQILVCVLCTYQPGGGDEKASLLRTLQVVEPSTSAVQVVQVLRAWDAAKRRAEELGVVIPDP